MGMVILAITGFQAYWIKDNYGREKKAVEVRTDALLMKLSGTIAGLVARGKMEHPVNGRQLNGQRN